VDKHGTEIMSRASGSECRRHRETLEIIEYRVTMEPVMRREKTNNSEILPDIPS